MSRCDAFPLPLRQDARPAGYDWEDYDVLVLSTASAFHSGIDQRDIFLGRKRCVICGFNVDRVLQHCRIIGGSEAAFWSELKDRNWIPPQAKERSQDEPRNGLLMCPDHRAMFDTYYFFIRYFPDTRKFVLVNHSCEPSLRQYHAKAIALDVRDLHAPFPSLFIIHEMRVRGFHLFSPVAPDVPDSSPFQDWIMLDGVFNNETGTFNRTRPPRNGNNGGPVQPQPRLQPTTSLGGTSSGVRRVELNQDVIDEILAATRAMPSWKACQRWNKLDWQRVGKY